MPLISISFLLLLLLLYYCSIKEAKSATENHTRSCSSSSPLSKESHGDVPIKGSLIWELDSNAHHCRGHRWPREATGAARNWKVRRSSNGGPCAVSRQWPPTTQLSCGNKGWCACRPLSFFLLPFSLFLLSIPLDQLWSALQIGGAVPALVVSPLQKDITVMVAVYTQYCYMKRKRKKS